MRQGILKHLKTFILISSILGIVKSNMDLFYVDDNNVTTSIVIGGQVYRSFMPYSEKGSCPRNPTPVFEGKESVELLVVTERNGSVVVFEVGENNAKTEIGSISVEAHFPNKLRIMSGCVSTTGWKQKVILVRFDSEGKLERNEYQFQFNFNCEAYNGRFSMSFVAVLLIALVVSMAGIIKRRPVGAIGDSFVREDTAISLGTAILWVMVFSLLMLLVNAWLSFMDISLRITYTLIGLVAVQLSLEDLMAIWRPELFSNTVAGSRLL